MNIVTGRRGKTRCIRAIHPNNPNVPIAGAIASERDFVTLRRKARLDLAGRIAGQSGRGRAMGLLDV